MVWPSGHPPSPPVGWASVGVGAVGGSLKRTMRKPYGKHRKTIREQKRKQQENNKTTTRKP